jgi:hypothetical protein
MKSGRNHQRRCTARRDENSELCIFTEKRMAEGGYYWGNSDNMTLPWIEFIPKLSTLGDISL